MASSERSESRVGFGRISPKAARSAIATYQNTILAKSHLIQNNLLTAQRA